MRVIDGYVCVAITNQSPYYPEKRLLFGPNKGHGTGAYENLVTNNITVYKNLAKAQEGHRQLSQRNNFSSVKIAKLHMSIAERVEELQELKDKDPLVVIMIDTSLPGKEMNLLGPMVDRKPNFHPIPAAFVYHTNFKTFDSLERAVYISKEVNRQAQCGAPIAAFRLEEIVEAKNKNKT